MTSNILDLDDIRDEARRRFQPVIVELSDETEVELKPLLRLGKKARAAVLEALEELKGLNAVETDEDDDEDEVADEVAEKVCAAVSKVLRLIASSPRRLIAELDREEDLLIRSALYSSVLKGWAREAQLGEAESSPS